MARRPSRGVGSPGPASPAFAPTVGPGHDSTHEVANALVLPWCFSRPLCPVEDLRPVFRYGAVSARWLSNRAFISAVYRVSGLPFFTRPSVPRSPIPPPAPARSRRGPPLRRSHLERPRTQPGAPSSRSLVSLAGPSGLQRSGRHYQVLTPVGGYRPAVQIICRADESRLVYGFT